MIKRRMSIVFVSAFLGMLGTSHAQPTTDVNSKSPAAQHGNVELKLANKLALNERIQLPGFSILPPQGENWKEGPRLPEPNPASYDLQIRIRFIKELPQNPTFGPHTASAQVGTIFLPQLDRRPSSTSVREFMQFRLKLAMALDKASESTRLISQHGQLDQSIGYTCAKYDAVMIQRGVEEFSKMMFATDYHGYECIDPSLTMIVSMSYVQTANSKAKLIDLSKEGGDFLRSLKFTARGRAPSEKSSQN